MKIDLSFVPPEKDSGARGSVNSEADRGAMGDAFGKAVRDAGGKRPADKAADKPEKANASDTNAQTQGVGTEAGTDTQAAAEPDAESAAEPAPLQTLLGALVAMSAPKAGAKGGAEDKSGDEAGQGAKAHAGLSVDLMAEGDGTAGAGGTDKRSMKLDVLRMETHFEPHQDGMLLVEGAAQQAKAAAALETKGKSGAGGAEALAASLALAAKTKSSDETSAAAAGKSSAADDGALVPMRFDEALARLGQGERSSGGRGGDNGRGSAGAQSALAELSARQTQTKGTDGITAILPGSSSPYNLAGQVAGPIMEALGDPGQGAAPSSSASQDAHLRMRAGGGALKTLTIQLHPEHLGTVDVSLRLNEGRLSLELAASRSDTASMLLDDQASLRKLLEHAGFSLDDAAISVITRDSGQARVADSAGGSAPQRDGSGGTSGDGRSDARGQPGSSEEQPGRRRQSARSSDDAAPAPKRSAATFL